MYLKSVLLATTAALLMSTSLISAQRGFLGGMTDEGYRPMDFSNDVYMGPGSKRHTRITKVKHRRHVSSDKQDAEPFVSGSEPGWGKNLSSEQRRMAGFDDARVAGKYARKPDTPSNGVPGYSFKLLTIWQNAKPGTSTVKSEPFGVYGSMQECDMARAAKIAELDAANLRQPRPGPGSQLVPTTTYGSTWGYTSTPGRSAGGGGGSSDWTYSNGTGYGHGEHGWGYSSIGPTSNGGGQSTSTTTQTQVGPTENMSVTFCEPGIYAPGPTLNIAKDNETTGAAPPKTETVTLKVPPGFVKHWVAPRTFTRVIPGTSEVIEILSAKERELVFMVKPDTGTAASLATTNILLVNDDGEVVANLRIVIPAQLNADTQQGPDGTQVYRKDNPDYVPPKVKK
jgi:hypothetical protein